MENEGSPTSVPESAESATLSPPQQQQQQQQQQSSSSLNSAEQQINADERRSIAIGYTFFLVFIIVVILALLITLAVNCFSSPNCNTGDNTGWYTSLIPQWAVLQILTNQSVANGDLVNFGTTPSMYETPYEYFSIDTGSTGTTRIVANVSGLYEFNSTVQVEPTAQTGSFGLHFLVNGSSSTSDRYGNSIVASTQLLNAQGLLTTAQIPLEPDDFVEVQLVLPGASTVQNTTVPSNLTVKFTPNPTSNPPTKSC